MRQFVAVLALAGVCLSNPHVNSGVTAGPLTPAVGDLVATPNGYRSFALEGFSEDLNQDGFVDPIGQAVPVVQHVAPFINYAAAPAYTYPAVKPLEVKAAPVISYAALNPGEVKPVEVKDEPVNVNDAPVISYAALNPEEVKPVEVKAVPVPFPVHYGVPNWPFQTFTRSINGCPYQVKVSRAAGTDDDKGPYKLLREYYGTYTIQTGTINGRDWYKKGDKVISYCGKNWNVASEGNRGECRGAFYTPDDHKCPNEPGYTWRYHVSAISEWIDAGKSMSIWSDSY